MWRCRASSAYYPHSRRSAPPVRQMAWPGVITAPEGPSHACSGNSIFSGERLCAAGPGDHDDPQPGEAGTAVRDTPIAGCPISGSLHLPVAAPRAYLSLRLPSGCLPGTFSSQTEYAPVRGSLSREKDLFISLPRAAPPSPARRGSGPAGSRSRRSPPAVPPPPPPARADSP